MKQQTIPACQSSVIQVKVEDLPLSCPTPDMQLWNGHPKVYLPIEETLEEVCPYCGTKFVLEQE